MALVPKLYSVSETFSSSGTVTNLLTVASLSGVSGVLGALSISPTRSSPSVSLHTIQLIVDGVTILNTSDSVQIESLRNLLEEGSRIFFRIPFRTSLQLKVKMSRPSTSGPSKALAMALVLVEE